MRFDTCSLSFIGDAEIIVESRFMMDKLKVGSEAIVVNSEEHSEWNFHKCKILSKEKDFIEVQIHEGKFVIENIKVKPNELIPILYDKKEDI